MKKLYLCKVCFSVKQGKLYSLKFVNQLRTKNPALYL